MAETQRDFIREMIDQDNRTGRFGGKVHTRYPPEPNAYMHLGHAKAVWINYGIALEYSGKFNLRFDDTNPTREEQEYVDAIIEDVRWLGADWEDRLFFASDYFESMYQWAEIDNTAFGFGTARPMAAQPSVKAFRARAFIGLPWPRNMAGMRCCSRKAIGLCAIRSRWNARWPNRFPIWRCPPGLRSGRNSMVCGAVATYSATLLALQPGP